MIGAFEAGLCADYSYKDGIFNDAQNSPFLFQRGYSTWNLSARLSRGESVDLILFMDNLTDERYIESGDSNFGLKTLHIFILCIRYIGHNREFQMRIACLGGGPSGLYFAISLKLRNPEHDVQVYERNLPGDTFGWGIVLSDQTMENLQANDPNTARSIHEELVHWDDIRVNLRGQVERSSGHGFIGIGRRRMLCILSERARQLGIGLSFSTEIEIGDLKDKFRDADLIVAADGLNSKVRNAYAEDFKSRVEARPNKFVWLGTRKRFHDVFSFIFEETEKGWVWAHAYGFEPGTTSFVVECQPDTHAAWGFDGMTQEESAEACRRIFSRHLDGHTLLTNSPHIRGSAWLNFPQVLCHNWIRDRLVLMGDAAHTAHFSIGSGTKLGMEDAICLAEQLHREPCVDTALRNYQEERQLEVLKLQSAARNSMTWFEELDRYVDYEIKPFTYALLTRSQRVSHENLRLRDANWLESVEQDFSRAAGVSSDQPVPPMFVPFRLRGLVFKNRIVVSPMSMYSAVDGMPDDWHLVHYGALAKGGAGLVCTEMTDVSPDARITPGCAGMWNNAQRDAWASIVDFLHTHTQAKFCLQLGHAGPKGSTKLAWQGMDEPLESGNWPLIGPSAVPYSPRNQVPREMTRADMDKIIQDFASATRRADEAGFDMIELHCAHGYLLSAFVTPLLNRRSDDYGGTLEKRLRFPLEVFAAMRDIWPSDKPISVRISSNDWVGDLGVTPQTAVEIAKAFKKAGVDIIDVSAGQTTPDARPVYGRMFQTPFSDAIRNEVGISTMAVGNIYEIDHVNSILAARRADLCCLGRPHLVDLGWTIRAAAEQHYHGDAVRIPVQYESGFEQLERIAERRALMGEAQ